MVLKLMRLLALLGIALMVALSAPVTAHQNEHKEARQAAEQRNHTTSGDMHQNMAAMPGMGEDGHGAMEEARPTTFSGRLWRFLGAMHPFAVHFPIALIPASWLALLIARRRGHAVDVIRAVIILAGIAAVGAALLGWFNAGFALTDRDPIQTYHRWIGTLLALIVGAIGVWGWRHTNSVNSRAMTWVLGATTLLLLVQGWLGATITHGMEHMSF